MNNIFRIAAPVRNSNGYIPEAFRREPQHGKIEIIVKRLICFRSDGQQRVRHVSPEKLLECSHRIMRDAMAGHADRKSCKDDHAILPLVAAEADSVIGPASLPVVVDVTKASAASVDGGGKVFVEIDRCTTVLINGQILAAKQFGCMMFYLRVTVATVIIELVDKQDVGPHALNDFGDLAGLFVV